MWLIKKSGQISDAVIFNNYTLLLQELSFFMEAGGKAG
jgi:hypothetical protein